jgi:asparagine synthase (glutamine-hydrolysing)
MCGIAGLYLDLGSRTVSRQHLEGMALGLAHRGPDGRGFHAQGRVGLAHTRLAIIDLAGGAQPLYNENRTLALVANGEIYNHLELRLELEHLGHRFATHSDSETILHAYEAWGERFLDHLYGMFAFALHDTVKGELILARDRLGIKPLYYSRGRQGLAFASEMKALRPFLDEVAVDPTGLALYLQNDYTPAPHTLFRGVHKLMPGTVIRVAADGATHCHKYWTPLTVKPTDWGWDEAAERFDLLMEEVMGVHLRSDVPMGLFLSGGVDSSILAALISRRIGEPLHTFSLGFPGTSVKDELSAAAKVAKRFGTRHVSMEVGIEDLVGHLPYTAWATDDLTNDHANLAVSLLAERASQMLKVVFSGEGGDEVFAGYGGYRQNLIRRLFRHLRGSANSGMRSRGMFSNFTQRLCRPELRQAMRDWRAPFVEAWRETPDRWTNLMRMQYVDLTHLLPDDLLIKADRMLMAWGVEGRMPYLDHRVVEFGLALPDRLKVEGRSGKVFLKRWAAQFLPKEHLWKRKTGFGVPIHDQLSGDWLKRYAEVIPNTEGVRAWFHTGALSRLIDLQRSKGRRAHQLMSLLNFALWHRIFIEGTGERPPKQQDPLAYLQGKLIVQDAPLQPLVATMQP